MPRIPCHVLIHSQSTYSALQFMNLHDDVRKVIDFLPNNFHELWARQVLVYNQAHTSPSGGETIKYKALDYQTIQENSPLEVHLIIVGFSRMGVALALEAIRVAHFANGKKTRITIIDKTATTERDYFRTRFPYFEKINEIDINFIEGGIETEDIRQKLFKWTLEKNVLPTIAICFNHPNKCLSSALTLPLGIYETETPILVQQEISYSMISLLNKNQDNFNKFKNVLPFGMTDQCFKIDRDRDLMAKAVSFFYHKDYSFNENVNTSDMEVYWKESQLINKWSNRYNADSFNFKIRALGLPSIDFKQPKKIKIREFEDSEIEILAKMEHARWNAERILAGYQPPSKSQMNESKDMELKAFKSHKSGLQKKMVHLCIVPYSQLREYYRDIDRKLVKAIPAILKLYSNEL